MADLVCQGSRQFLGFLWKTICGYPLPSEAGVCWRCGTLGPKHPTRIFFDKLKSATLMESLGEIKPFPKRSERTINFTTHGVDTDF